MSFSLLLGNPSLVEIRDELAQKREVIAIITDFWMNIPQKVCQKSISLLSNIICLRMAL